MARTRLCIVNPFLHGGGAEYQIALLMERLKQTQRFEMFYLAHHLSDAVRPDGFEAVQIGRGQRVPLLGYTADVIPLYGALRRIRPQVIYQRVAGGYTGICALYAQRHHVPLVWHVAHDTDVLPDSLDTGRNFLRPRLEKWSVRYGIPRADIIITQTEHQADLLYRNYGRRADAIVANFHPEPGEAADKSGVRTVVWIANLKPWKRPEVFVRLAQALQDLPDVEFLMVGAAPPGTGWRDALMQSIAATPNLHHLGHKSQSEVNALLARASVFVNTSRYEGFPNTFIQSWLRDAAVVSLDVNPDSVLDTQRVGIHARSEEGLAQAVRTLLTQPATLAGYVERGRAHARSKHSVRNSEQLVQILEGCITGAEPQLC